MYVRRKRGWEIPASKLTPEGLFVSRRGFLEAGAGALLACTTPGCLRNGKLARETPLAAEADPSSDLYPVRRSALYPLDRPITEESWVTRYNNFYEFSTDKTLSREAQALRTRPWTISIDGLVERPQTIEIDTLIRKMPLEERTYRHRCVETWAIAVPWTGFPLRALVDLAKPLGSARCLRLESFLDTGAAPRQRQVWLPFPYVEALTLPEAVNELAFLVTGAYGKPLAKQNGAPLRLAAPWKYGFKSIKSIVRFTFTQERPVSFWEKVGPKEYGFWANVNPDVPHPRWSQASETMLGTKAEVPTRIYNGYGEFVAHLYTGLENERLFF
jgi:sulfoxide reductase catalytic subunit YedY